jgi:MFS family permease
VAFGYIIGPVLGGVLVQKVSWRVSNLITTHIPSTHVAVLVVLLDQYPYLCLCDTSRNFCATFEARAGQLSEVRLNFPLVIY